MTPGERAAELAALVAAYNGDAIFRPSSIERTIGCPGSVRLIARAPKRRRMTPWIVEGLAAHKVGEDCLRNNRESIEWFDRMVRVDDEGMEGAFVDQEMVDGLALYLSTVRDSIEDGDELTVEHKVSLKALDPDEPMFAQNRGTTDARVASYRRRILRLFDLKWGKGVKVSPETPQLKNYALMELIELEGDWDAVECTIVQPRDTDESQRVKRVSYDPNYLLTEFLGTLVGAMESSLEPDPPLSPGARCRWCPASSICPALRESAMHLADDPFRNSRGFRAGDALGPLPAEVFIGTNEEPRPATYSPGRVVLPAAPDMTPDEIGAVLSRRHLWETWISAVQHRAVALLDTGTAIPGWKLGRRTKRRRWKDPATTPDALRMLGLQTVQLYSEPKLLSPRQIEIKLAPGVRDAIETLVERPMGDIVLIPEDSAKAGLPPSLGPFEPDDD